MELDTFKQHIKSSRPKYFLAPKELVYENFVQLGFHNQNKDFFFNEASQIVEQLRESTWKKYKVCEDRFTTEVTKSLINEQELDRFSKREIIVNFIENYAQHSYSLALSNTQSRRARAGNEFEYMIELILIGANIPFDTQGSVGSGVFESSKLAKLVDCVSPGANEYRINKRHTSLISAKTTLRERWQEVGDEMSRTKASEMYLASLDGNITNNTLSLLSTNNIIIVTTKNLKNTHYSENHNVITFESMLHELVNHYEFWKTYKFSEEEIAEKIKRYKKLVKKNLNKEFVRDYYQHMIEYVTETYS